MITIYTIHMSKHRLLQETTVSLLDTTVKSGIAFFAPTWDMVMSYKKGVITEEQYIDRYRQALNGRHRDNPAYLTNYLPEEGDLALGCYCKPGEFCHRHLLKYALQNWGKYTNVPVVLGGEITPAGLEEYPELDQRIQQRLSLI